MKHSVWMVAAFGAALAACGGGAGEAPPAVAPTAPAAAPSEGASAAPSASAAPQAEVSWDAMGRDQKLEIMRTVVTPKMKAAFHDVDAQKYAEVGCATCHGAGAKDKSFTMPNPGLPALDPTDGFKKHMDANPKVTKFMMETVVPEMAKALHEKPYDPATGKGFGCFDCHTKAK